MKAKIFFLFRLLVTAAILFALFKFVPYEKLVSVYKDSKKGYLALGFSIFFLCQVIGIFRWRFILSSLGINISIREAFYSCFCGLFLNLFFPSFVAGDVFRSFC
ncbi:MAG: flippase-like domain-containing protein, partial [Candidatus Omnitrophica bacterium]|nr:flippase-like domain-containing protein [Candidatus Omnitrophota bacterium]